MMKTAIIDNGIDIKTLSLYKNQTKHFAVRKGNVVFAEPPQATTHGGLCAQAFAKQAGALPDISICLDRDASQLSNSNELAAALEWCAENGVELITLSMGTTEFRDISGLRLAAKKLQNAQTVLVAASSNDKLITYPAAFHSCISVCYWDSAHDGGFTYIGKPFDGVNVAAKPIISGFGNSAKSNSITNAYIAGMICKAFDGATGIGEVRRWLTKISIKPTVDREAAYLKEKIAYISTDETAPVIITCCGVPTKSAEAFMKKLQRIITLDNYICAILWEQGANDPVQYRFSLPSSRLSPTDTLELVTSLCRPSIILNNLNELTHLSDVLIYGDQSVPSGALLISKFENITPKGLWLKTKELFENNE